ncbi:MAG: 50S ribosomal protein L5 [Methanophagales archaeon]|nr:50S ribosomal protein L5 [Methanophagales archaeon]RLG33968.1 MAG: 50S ribosomal protein L5 [Methanosarcinales archaeon]MCW3138197.1 50S ribosomal protein L5 [Methanophagales archaeon]MCW3139153.1 50S ribosomal protein L5 [Methanophagales archaeon]MCW7069771.1 50S ribosomal protein L5 [Methanophagales archaeon]
MESNQNPMRRIEVDKVVINMGVGESGEKLAKAEKLLAEPAIAGQKPIKIAAKRTIQPFGIKRGEAIACKVTLRGARAHDFLTRVFKIQNKLYMSQFDTSGNFSFGIAEHTDFGIRYDPNVGIFGMDVSVSLKRPGYRIKERRIQRKKVPARHRLTRDECIAFLEKEYGVEVVAE